MFGREERSSVLDFYDHAFAGAVGVRMAVMNFPFILIARHPVKFQAVLVVAHREIDLLDRDRFNSGRFR